MAEGLERIHLRIDDLQKTKADKADVDALRSDIAKVIEGQHELALAINNSLRQMPIQPCRDLMTLRQRHEAIETTVLDHLHEHRQSSGDWRSAAMRVIATLIAAALIAGAGYAYKGYIDAHAPRAAHPAQPTRGNP